LAKSIKKVFLSQANCLEYQLEFVLKLIKAKTPSYSQGKLPSLRISPSQVFLELGFVRALHQIIVQLQMKLLEI